MRRLLLALAWKLDHLCHAMIERLDPVEQADVRKMLESAFGLHPRRNCDRFNTGDVEQDADAALRAMLDEMKADGNFGYRGVASYLLSPAKSDAAATAETAEAKPAPASLLPEGVRPATEEEVEAGDAQWCDPCRNADCPFAGRDILVHGCSQASPKDSLS